jgi:hypothetical protein
MAEFKLDPAAIGRPAEHVHPRHLRRPATEATYMYLTTLLSECSHFGHSNVRRSCRGRSGSMRASSIAVPHWGHGCRTIAFDSMVTG